jgi:hypothetical protein
MTTKFNPENIRQLLNQSTGRLDSNTLASLQQARTYALQRQAVPAPALQLAGHRLSSMFVPHNTQQWIVAGLLALLLAAGAGMEWQHFRHQELVDLDVEILTDELPIEVFLD